VRLVGSVGSGVQPSWVHHGGMAVQTGHMPWPDKWIGANICTVPGAPTVSRDREATISCAQKLRHATHLVPGHDQSYRFMRHSRSAILLSAHLRLALMPRPSILTTLVQ
jgi:hypothetical protein